MSRAQRVLDLIQLFAAIGARKKRGLTILQEPVRMDFGTAFVATDPDGHRLRVFVPAAA